MAEYIDRDELLKELCTVSAPTPSESWIVEKCIEKANEQPTADVVPNSEVERLEHILDCYALQYGTVTNQREVIDKVKAEVAREIFEEIERFLYLHFRFCKEDIGNDDTEYVKGRLELNTQIQNFIAELKKKYLEGVKNAEKNTDL